MTTKSVNIDDLLAENELTLTMGGKEYIVKDIALDNFLKIMKAADEEKPNPELIFDQLALFFRVDKKELRGIGIKAAGLALNEINLWMTAAGEDLGVDVTSSDGGADDIKNP